MLEPRELAAGALVPIEKRACRAVARLVRPAGQLGKVRETATALLLDEDMTERLVDLTHTRKSLVSSPVTLRKLDFYFTISKEKLGDLKSDLIVSYADTAQLSKTFLTSQPAQLMDQVKRGAVAEVTGTEFIASVSPPTALSLTWGLDEYVAALSKAAKAADKKS